MDKRSKVMDAPGDRVNRQRLQKAAEAHIRLLAEAAPGKDRTVNKIRQLPALRAHVCRASHAIANLD